MSGIAIVTVAPQVLLVGAVVGVGILHTMVPDHWAPIAIIARQAGWSRRETARAAVGAGTGHVVSTLIIGLAVWVAGAAFATKFGAAVSRVSSSALIAFGVWIAIASVRELREMREPHRHAAGPVMHDAHADLDRDAEPEGLSASSGGGVAVALRHAHAHRHRQGMVHAHVHDHDERTPHHLHVDPETGPPLHDHKHKRSTKTALLLILGSSPMVEGIPAFFAAGKYGFGLIAIMSVAFGVSTILTYVALCVYSAAGLERLKLGSFEQYGEVISGAFIALVGVVFLAFPML